MLQRNVQLAFEVVHAAVADETAAEEAAFLGRDGGLVLADPSDADLSLANEQLYHDLEARGERVVFVEVNKSISLRSSHRLG
jgi:hypothetical protein